MNKIDYDQQWAPASRSLVDEFPALATRLRAEGFDVHRVMFQLADWDTTPRKVQVGGHTVKFGGFRSQRPGVITVVDATGTNRVEVTDRATI